jgi:phosphoribosylanthranilate isomerase
MSFLTNIKLGSVTNLSDARFAAAAGVTYIGFCFDPQSTNYIAPLKAKEIIDWISGSSVVAEFGNQSLEEIRDITQLLNVDVIEVNNQLLPDELLSLDKAIIKKIDVNQFSVEQLETEIATYNSVADGFHLYASSKPEKYDCNLLAELCKAERIIWGLELNTNNILNIIQSFKPFALDIIGGNEEKTGVNDFDELGELFERISID